MSLIRFYLYREKVIVPKVEQTEAGFFVDSQPVEVYKIKDRAAVYAGLVKALKCGNNVIATPEGAGAASVLLDHLDLSKWSSFEKSAVLYTVLLGGRYATIYASGRGADGMWKEAASKVRQFHPSLSLDMLAHTLVSDMITQPEAKAEKFSLTLVSKSS